MKIQSHAAGKLKSIFTAKVTAGKAVLSNSTHTLATNLYKTVQGGSLSEKFNGKSR